MGQKHGVPNKDVSNHNGFVWKEKHDLNSVEDDTDLWIYIHLREKPWTRHCDAKTFISHKTLNLTVKINFCTKNSKQIQKLYSDKIKNQQWELNKMWGKIQ